MATNTKPLMACGCRQQGLRITKDNRDGVPVCVAHGVTELWDGSEPDLTGRTARCSCGKERSSSDELAFFEYRGHGSRAAAVHCKNCGYYPVAHEKDNVRHCGNFEPHGPYEFDHFYCGCRGWD